MTWITFPGEKETVVDRTYESQAGCPVAATLDLIGDRWTILILRDLVLGRSGKFKDFLQSLRGISPHLLAQRLKRLQHEGILEREFYSDHPPRARYRLTATGEGLGRIVRAMADWGYEHRLSDEQRPAARAMMDGAKPR